MTLVFEQLGLKLTDMESIASQVAGKIGRPDAHIVAANADLVIKGHAPGKDHSDLSWHR